MAKIYYNLIHMGTWTIDQVPALWREQTQELLDADNDNEE